MEERPDTPADTMPTFEALWRTYDFAKGKKAAREAWNALPPEVDRAAVIRAAAAWRASWRAQGKPDAPRFTLARWLKDERYDEDPPRGYQPKEKPGKAKPAKPVDDFKKFTITDYQEDGSWFGTMHINLTFRAVDGEHEFTRRLHVLQANADFGEGADKAEFNEIHHAAFGKGEPTGKWVGRVLGLDGTGWWGCPDDNPEPEEPEPLPAPEPKPWTEADEAALKARIDAIAPRREPTEWERKKAAQWRRDAGRKEWDKAHPEFFETPAGEEMTWAQAIKLAGEDAPRPAANDPWPAWMDDDYERDDEAA
ncbi:hypothetical protein J4G48_0020210 [Bradyrhizobium barranii subsp. apii]|uniref:hypothetical protein n=1 Tax=Bradyrhizobium barranii TaxID=2992140 RepID=UPI001AA0D82E|nr:hypothetical protein [Bradyrhizobium barranii]UPU00208.1 hypothetical protein J4G48_0020210 [Bradyrhizobium barranii subsp. apii]